MRRIARLAAGAMLLAAACAAAQQYPQRPIRMLVGLPAGGSTDIMGRLIAAKIGERLGQQVVFENRPGASGIIAADIVAKSQPDGYTLLLTTMTTMSINPQVVAKLPYDAFKDFAPVTSAVNVPYMLAAHPSLAANTKTWSLEFAPFGIRVGAVAPGMIETDMSQVVRDTLGSRINDVIPLKRVGQSEEVARVIVFLASDDASYLTGQVLRVDGGLSLGGY